VEYSGPGSNVPSWHSSTFGPVKKFLGYIPYRLRNRYGIAVLALVAWITLFDRNDAWTTFKNSRDLARMEEDKGRYTAEISSTKDKLHQLSSDKELLEKFAREEYLMKRDNEDIFVLVPAKR